MQVETVKIDTWERLQRLFSYADKVKSGLFVFDLETDGLLVKSTNVYCIGVCFDKNRVFYIPWRDRPAGPGEEGAFVWPKNSRDAISKWIKEQSQSKKLIGHNIIFDVLVSKQQLGIDLTHDVYCDTILLKHTIDEEPPFGLKDCAVRDLGDWADKAQQDLKDEVKQLGGKWTREQKDMYLATRDTLGIYCAWDVFLTLLLYEKYSKRLQDEGLEKLFYEDEVMPLYKWVTIPMKDKGFPINVAHFEKLKEDISVEIDKAESEVRNDIRAITSDFEDEELDKKVPISSNGNSLFPKEYARKLGIPLPETKQGKVTLAAAAVKKQLESCPEHSKYYNFLLGEEDSSVLDQELVREVRVELALKKKTGDKPSRWERGHREYFNLSSGDHLGYLFFTKLGIEPTKMSPSGNKPSTDREVIDTILSKYGDIYEFLSTLLIYRQLSKLKATYIEGILSREINGVLYPDMLQFGTTSGRYASRAPNIQNQPRERRR